MKESYSKEEIDLKIALANEHTALIEERVEHKFTQLLSEIKEGFLHINNNFENRFNTVERDLAGLNKLTLGVFFLLLSILVGGAIKLLFH